MSASPLHFDSAQTDQNRDEFGFAALAENLSSSIAGLLASTASGGSFVVGLEGKWGSGKSTILNYLRIALGKRFVGERQFIVDFDPWWLEDGANIASSLLGDVLSTLPQKEAKLAAKAVGSLASAVSKMPDGVEAILKLSKKTEAFAEIIQAMKQAGGDLSSVLNASKPARRLREDVAKAFQDGGFQFVVFIDDLDRLTPQQALQVMGAIRSIADLPGFVYVLAYDPDALANILKSSIPPLGHDYVEKIVNVSLPVPPITFAQMEVFIGKLLAAPLWSEITEPEGAQHKQALISVLETPRDAVRFANSANFWIGAKTQEVFVPDFLLLEAIRLARPPVYDGLLRTAELWVERWDDSVISRALGEDTDKAKKIERKKAKVDAELRLNSTQRDETIRKALGVLFPKAAAILGQERTYGTITPDAQSISVSDHFFTYFLHKPVPGAATKGEVDELVAEQTSAERREELIGMISSRAPGDVSPLRHLIAMIDARIERNELSRRVAVEVATAFVAPTTVHAPLNVPIFDSDLYAVRGVVARALKYAKQLTDEQVLRLGRPEIPLSTMTLLHVTLTVGTRFYLLEDPPEERMVSAGDTALGDFTNRFLDRALAAIEDGTVQSTADPPWLYFMSYKGRPAELKRLMTSIMTESNRFLEVIESHRGYMNPVLSLAKFSDLRPQEFKAKVLQALAELGLEVDDWGPWSWFQSIE